MQKFFIKNFKFNVLAVSWFFLVNLVLSAATAPSLLDADGNPRPAVLSIYQTLGLGNNHSTEALVHIGMSKFKAPSKETWQTSEIAPQSRTQIMKDFEALGLVQAYSPSFESYEEIWIYGARLEHMFDRMNFVCERIAKKTLRANRIYILTGQRLLDPETESLEVWQRLVRSAPANYPCTENEAAATLWQSACAQHGTNHIQAKIISVPMQPTNQGSSMRRPNTADTIYTRLNEMPIVSGKILGISNNPSIAYQHSVALNCLRDYMGNLSIHPITLETVGNASSPKTTNRAYLYRIVATLREELKSLLCN